MLTARALALLPALVLALSSTACGGGDGRGARSGKRSLPTMGDHRGGDADDQRGGDADDKRGGGASFDAEEGFSVRFPAGYPEPQRTQKGLDDGVVVAYISASRSGVCGVTYVDGGREMRAEDPRKLISGFESGLLGDDGEEEDGVDFKFAGAPARTMIFRKRSDDGSVTYWRVLVVVGKGKLYATAFMSPKERARWSPAVEAYLTSIEW